MKRVLFFLTIILTLTCSATKFSSSDLKTTMVTYYSDKFNGRKTSSGEVFNNKKFTAAHYSLPLGTKVLLTNLETGDTVTVKVNDRGPLHKGRAFDVTKAAFQKLGDVRKGVLKVSYKILD